MIKRMALAIFLCVISNPTSALTYREIAKACYQHRDKVSISDCVACYSDAMKYCSHIKGTDNLENLGKCLHQNIDKLKPACKRVLQKHFKPS